MLLSTILSKEKNNLDIFRLIFGFMVIYGHAYALVPVDGKIDVVARIIDFDYSGSLAVKMFFFLSGLVVANSLIDKKNFSNFIISRAFRIYPALIVVTASMAFLLGPLLSNVSFFEYFKSPIIYDYFFSSLVMDFRYELPGVFENNTVHAVNGSLWSISFEVYAYILLGVMFLLGLVGCRFVSLVIVLLVIIDAVSGNKLLFTWLPKNPEVTLLAPCFSVGVIFAIFKDKIKINRDGFFSLWILYFLFRTSSYNFYFFYIAIFYSVVFLSSLELMLKFKPSNDISYGVYLWGWPTQQVMAQYFSGYGVEFNQISSIAIAAILGYLSWYFVEKRFIAHGSNFIKYISRFKKPLIA